MHDREHRNLPVGYRHGWLEVRCWCEMHHVGVTEREVRYGWTRSCGKPECTQIERRVTLERAVNGERRPVV